MCANSNLVPFRTIRGYILHFINHSMNQDTIVRNLLGNLIIFMPMGIFLPGLFQKARNWRGFLTFMVIILLGTEIIQLITRAGIFDIDDFILNMAGACGAFAVFRLKRVEGFMEKLYLR